MLDAPLFLFLFCFVSLFSVALLDAVSISVASVSDRVVMFLFSVSAPFCVPVAVRVLVSVALVYLSLVLLVCWSVPVLVPVSVRFVMRCCLFLLCSFTLFSVSGFVLFLFLFLFASVS